MLNKLTKIKRLLLIGKEIWHNKRSMRGRFIIYLLSLVLLAGSAMLILLNVIGIVQPPSHDIDRFLEYELNTRTNDIKRQMNALAAHNIDLSQQLQNDIDRVMLEQGIYNNYDALNNNPEALTAIQQATYQTLAAKMQQAPASGALYLINASVNTNLLEPTYNGLFLKFTNIYSENTLFNETCMFRGNPQVARNNNISLYSTWQLELNVHAYPQADKLLHAKENNISQQYILTDVAHLKESWEQSRLFLMPINSNNGRIIGICGFEISSVYFQQRTKQANYKGYPLITAILDKKADNEYQGQLSNPASFVNATIKTSSDGEHELFTAGQERFIGFTAPLKVGVSEHKVAVMLPADSYYHLQGQAKMRLLIMLGIILLLSLLSAGYFSKKYVDPLVADLQQLQQNPDAPPQANVLELNQFFEFLQNHSEQQAEKLRQLQSENNQVQKQYGLAAMRLQEAQKSKSRPPTNIFSWRNSLPPCRMKFNRYACKWSRRSKKSCRLSRNASKRSSSSTLPKLLWKKPLKRSWNPSIPTVIRCLSIILLR